MIIGLRINITARKQSNKERRKEFMFAMKKVITYGTFDLLHWGHIKLLERAKQLGDYLVVAISTDEFNLQKSKRLIIATSIESSFLKRFVM